MGKQKQPMSRPYERSARIDQHRNGERTWPLQLEEFTTAFSIAGEPQEKAADEKTLASLERFSGNPQVEKARTGIRWRVVLFLPKRAHAPL